MADISNSSANTLVSGTAMSDRIFNGTAYSNVDYSTVDAGGGNDTIRNGYHSYYSDAVYPKYTSINGGAGKDSIHNWGDYSTIEGGDGDDTIINNGDNVTISCGAGNDSFHSSGYTNNVLLSGGDGDDYFYIRSDLYVTVTGGKGNDTIKNDNDRYDSIFLLEYEEGDGNDYVIGYTESSMIQIGGGSGTYYKEIVGNNVILGVGDGSITLAGAANMDVYIDGVDAKMPIWWLNGTTATYGTTTKKIITVKGVKSTDGLSVNGKVVTVAASSLNKSKVTISKGYTLALADDVTKTSNKKAWSLSGTTAKYNQTTTAGYKLADNVITYTKKSTKTLATVNGAKSKSGLSVSGKTIKLAASALNKKVSVSGGYAFDFASDYKKAKITGSSSADTITTAGANMTISGGAGNDSIVSKGKNSVITGGKGKDTLTGSSGADIFVYSSGDGNDVITNFDENDKISLKSGATNISTSGNDVIFTVDTGTITLKDAKDKTITYFDAGGKENIYPNKSDDVTYSKSGKLATLKYNYDNDSFEASSTLVTINAAAVEQSLKIIGNKKANRIVGTEEDDIIYGGDGKDTILGGDGNDELYGDKGNDSLVGGKGSDSLWGGKGDDILTGGAGNDIFYYDDGDGNDTIINYSPGVDSVVILSPKINIGNPDTDNSGNVTFKVGTGQITFKNSANKYIELVTEGGNVLMKYNPR